MRKLVTCRIPGRSPAAIAWVSVILFVAVTAGGRRGLAQVPPVPPSEAPFDTLTARLTLPEDLPDPVSLTVQPDSILFGGVVTVVLEFAEPNDPLVPLEPGSDVDWLTPESPENGSWLDKVLGRSKSTDAPVRSGGTTPATASAAAFRVYRPGPFRVAVGELTSGVLQVVGRTEGLDQTAAIRQPRQLPFPYWLWGVLVLAAALLFWVVNRLRGRGRDDESWKDWNVRVPGWMEAVVDLDRLLQDDPLARGDVREHLDRLAGIVRGYLANRFRMAAREMTGDEIVTCGVERGFSRLELEGPAGIVDLADRARFDPELPTATLVRELTTGFFESMKDLRIHADYADDDAVLRLTADKAWDRVRRQLDPVRSGGPAGEGG